MTPTSRHRWRIVSANESHLPAISRLAGFIWRACYPGIITGEQIEYMLEKMYSLETLGDELRSGICYLQLLVDDEMVGFASYGPSEQPLDFKLHKLYLHPDHQGFGLGSRLLQQSEHDARELGAARLILNVNKGNAKAIATYQRNGFHIIDAIVVNIGGGFVMDDYVMAKNLASDEKLSGSS